MLPKSTPGMVHFDLTIENIEMNTNEVFFQYITDSVVTHIIPSFGFSSTHVLTIFGENFQLNTAVYVSGEVVSTYFVNSSSLVCTFFASSASPSQLVFGITQGKSLIFTSICSLFSM